MANQDKNYRFRPLDPEQDEIRILLLDPEEDGTTLRGRLDHIKLSATRYIAYESISNCWGELDLIAELTSTVALYTYPKVLRSPWNGFDIHSNDARCG